MSNFNHPVGVATDPAADERQQESSVTTVCRTEEGSAAAPRSNYGYGHFLGYCRPDPERFVRIRFDYVKFGADLKAVRKKRKLSLQSAATEAGVAQSRICRTEKAQPKYTRLETILRLAIWADLDILLYTIREG